MTETYCHEQTMEDILLAFRQFAVIAAHIDDGAVETARTTVATAESIGFVIDPTKYRDALQNGSLERQRRIVALYQKTKKELREVFPEGWPA